MWYFEQNGQQRGPEDSAQIQRRLAQGELSGATLVWRDGMVNWEPLSQIEELQPGNSLASNTAPAPVNPAAGVYTPPQHMQGVPGMVPQPSLNGMALASMILAICSIVFTFGCGIGFVFAIPAVILGHIARKQIREWNQLQTGDGMALAGLIMGYLMLAFLLIGFVIIGVSFATHASSTSP